MTLASRRLIRKRPFISASFDLKMASGDRQRGGGRDEQKRGDEGTGEDGDGLTERSGSNHFKTPLHSGRTRPSGPCHYQCTGRANSEKSRLFNDADWRLAKFSSNVRREVVEFASQLDVVSPPSGWSTCAVM